LRHVVAVPHAQAEQLDGVGGAEPALAAKVGEQGRVAGGRAAGFGQRLGVQPVGSGVADDGAQGGPRSVEDEQLPGARAVDQLGAGLAFDDAW
jgi:hypothetical protein